MRLCLLICFVFCIAVYGCKKDDKQSDLIGIWLSDNPEIQQLEITNLDGIGPNWKTWEINNKDGRFLKIQYTLDDTPITFMYEIVSISKSGMQLRDLDDNTIYNFVRSK